MYRGRESLLRLAEECVDARGGPRIAAGTDRPVVVLEGCGGSGRTSTLRTLAAEHGAAVPLARLDARQAEGLSAYGDVSGLLLLAASGLSDTPKGTPRLRFHRLFAAHAALALEIDLAQEPEPARRQMRDALARHRHHESARELAGRVLTGTGVTVLEQLTGRPPLGELTASIRAAGTAMTSALSRSSRLVREALGGARWVPDEPDGRTTDPILAMIELNRWWRTAQQSKIDRRLVSVFRADLRLARRRRYNCELLIDHADNPAVTTFLRHLVAGRRERGARPDPLTVVAASGGSLLAELQPAPRTVRRYDEAELSTVTAPDLADLSWLRVRLGPLSRSDVVAMISADPDFAGVDEEWTARVVLANTGGHPGAVSRFVEALRHRPHLFDDVEKLLDTQVDEHGTLAESIQWTVVHDTDAGSRPTGAYLETFTTLAAARHTDEADRMVAGGKLAGATSHDLELLQAETLWPPPHPGAPGRLLPVARFLLLRRLRQRPPGDTSWGSLFAWLSGTTPAGDPAGRLHHRFAMGEPVGEELREQLTECTATEWLDRLDQIVAIPNPEAPGAGSRPDQWTLGENVADTIDHLTLALRELNDPRLTDKARFHDRCLHVAHLYLELSRRVDQGARAFRRRTESYRSLAKSYL